MPGGRPPKPAALRKVSGNAGKRPIPNEPTPPEGDVAPPPWADEWPEGGDEWRVWRHLAPLLEGMDVLTTVDPLALGQLCEAMADYLDARRTVRNEGATQTKTTDRGGESIAAHPATAIASDAWRRVNVMLGQFGLTPSMRAKLGVGGGEAESDPFAGFDGDRIADGKRAN